MMRKRASYFYSSREQRVLKLRTSYTVANNGSATLHVSHMPSNPAVFSPSPAMLFITVNGVPSVGQWVMVGSGSIGIQPTGQK
jgi:hypothetical protein